MSKLTDPHQARQLARAVVSDVSLYYEKYVARSREKGKIIRPLREALQEAYGLFESRVDVSIPACAACFDEALDEILQISISFQEAPSVVVEAEAEPPPASSSTGLDPAFVSVLTDPNADPRQAEKIVTGLAGQSLSGTMKVERVTLTTESRLPSAVQFGRTVIGVLPDGLRVSVAFPKARNDEIQAVREGSAMQFQGQIMLWDGLFKYLVLAAMD